MKARNPASRVPEINLFVRQQRASVEPSGARRTFEAILLVGVVVIWAALGVFIATLFGWHPDLGP